MGPDFDDYSAIFNITTAQISLIGHSLNVPVHVVFPSVNFVSSNLPISKTARTTRMQTGYCSIGVG